MHSILQIDLFSVQLSYCKHLHNSDNTIQCPSLLHRFSSAQTIMYDSYPTLLNCHAVPLNSAKNAPHLDLCMRHRTHALPAYPESPRRLHYYYIFLTYTLCENHLNFCNEELLYFPDGGQSGKVGLSFPPCHGSFSTRE
jgi:hypothetical protein